MNIETKLFMNSNKIMQFMNQSIIFKPKVKANIHIIDEFQEST
jgi:hypothetical protein